jgi:hypothetical protein
MFVCNFLSSLHSHSRLRIHKNCYRRILFFVLTVLGRAFMVDGVKVCDICAEENDCDENLECSFDPSSSMYSSSQSGPTYAAVKSDCQLRSTSQTAGLCYDPKKYATNPDAKKGKLVGRNWSCVSLCTVFKNSTETF